MAAVSPEGSWADAEGARVASSVALMEIQINVRMSTGFVRFEVAVER